MLDMPHAPRQDDGVSLREWVDSRFAQQQIAVDRLAESQQRALELLAQTTAQQTNLLRGQVEQVATLHADAHAREHALTQEALNKAENAMERRLAGMNEFRDQLRDQASTFVRRELLDERMVALTERVEREAAGMNQRLTLLEREASTLQGRFWALGVGVGLLVVALNLASRWLP